MQKVYENAIASMRHAWIEVPEKDKSKLKKAAYVKSGSRHWIFYV